MFIWPAAVTCLQLIQYLLLQSVTLLVVYSSDTEVTGMAVTARHGSRGTSRQLWHIMAVMAHHGSYGTLPPYSSYSTFPLLYCDCYAQHTRCPSRVPCDSCPDRDCGTRTNRDSTVTRLRNALPKNRFRFPTPAEISFLSTEFRPSLGVTTVCTGSCNREAPHTSACSVGVKIVWDIDSVGSETSGNEV